MNVEILEKLPAQSYEVGRTFEFRVRAIYKRYTDDDDVIAEYRAARQAVEADSEA